MRHFDDGGRNDGKDGNKDGKDTEKGPTYHSEDISNGLSKDSNDLLKKEGYVERVKRLEDWRYMIEKDDEDDRNNEDASTVETQIKFISDSNYDPFTPEEIEKRRRAEIIQSRDITQDSSNKKARDPLAPDPHTEFHDAPSRPQRQQEIVKQSVRSALKRFVHHKK